MNMQINESFFTRPSDERKKESNKETKKERNLERKKFLPAGKSGASGKVKR